MVTSIPLRKVDQHGTAWSEIGGCRQQLFWSFFGDFTLARSPFGACLAQLHLAGLAKKIRMSPFSKPSH
jgi:hypothetical protein